MKEKILFFVVPGLLIVLVFLFPFFTTTVVDKDNVKHIYAFAGDIDQGNGRQHVSVEVACDYWLERDEQPELRYVRTCRLGLVGLLFGLSFNY
jgi:hypothetical protein